MIDEILLWIMALAPSVTAIFTTLGMVITVLKNFKKLKEDIKSREELEDIKARFKKILKAEIEKNKDKIKRSDIEKCLKSVIKNIETWKNKS